MERGGVTEMDRRKSAKNMEMQLNISNIITHSSNSGIFILLAVCPSVHFIDTSSIHFCDTWSVHSFHIDQNSSKKLELKYGHFHFKTESESESIFDSGSGQTENYANTHIS